MPIALPSCRPAACLLTCLLTCLLAVTGALPARAAGPIDFETLPNGTVVTNQYAGQGVTFSSPADAANPVINNFSGFSTSGQVLADYTGFTYQIDASFSTPVTAFASLVYANPGYTVTVNAYDSANTLLGFLTLGTGSYQRVVSMSGIGLIGKITWSTNSNVAAVGIDDLSFTQAVPEPAAWAMAGLAVLGLGLARRRRA